MRTINRALVILITISILLQYVQIYAETTNIEPLKKSRDRAKKAMDLLLCGPADVPARPSRRCPDEYGKEGSGGRSPRGSAFIDRSISKLALGVWQVVTFWYPDSEAESSSKDNQ